MHAVVLDTGTGDTDFVRRVLRDVEYAPRVTSAESGAELASMARGADLVLAPWELPDMRFRKLRYHLDALRWDGALAVLATNHGEIQQALRAGAHFGLKRPLDATTLVRALRHFRLLPPEAPVPLVEEVEDTWSVALRRPFDLAFTAEPIDLSRPGSVWLAEYGPRADATVSAITVLDEELGVGLGAAVSLIPPAMTREVLRRRASHRQLAKNLNMVCALLVDLYASPVPLELKQLRRTTHVSRTLRRRLREDRRLDLAVDLRDYGQGRATFAQLDGGRGSHRPPPAPARVAAPAARAQQRFL